MTSPSDAAAIYNKNVPWITHALVSLVILAIAGLALKALFGSKPEARKWGNQQAASVAVEVTQLTPRDYPVWLDSYGTAEALTRTQLVAEVNGRVVSVSDRIRSGADFVAGDILMQLDDRDFKVDVDIAASEAANAKVAYLQEVAEAELAAKDWNERPGDDAARLLALRKPQVEAAKAGLQAAEARLARARLNLERTRIRAPFDGRVLDQLVDVGQVVSPSQAIAEIYSTEAVEVRLPLKASELAYVNLPEGQASKDRGPAVLLTGDFGQQSYQWQAQIVRSEGTFDPATRMLYVVARVKDPFVDTAQRPAIRIGQFVRAQIAGETLQDVLALPRRAVSQDYVVNVAEEGLLRKRHVQPLWTDARYVVVSANATSEEVTASALAPSVPKALRATDTLILTPAANLPDGTRIKAMGKEAETIMAKDKGASSGAPATARAGAAG